MRIFIDLIGYYIPFVTMLIMSIILIVICCKQHGKEPATPFTCDSLISCCACAVVDITFMSPWMFVMFFGWYDLWVIAAFIGMYLQGILCLFWLVICKDIQDSALCKSTKSGEKAELLSKWKRNQPKKFDKNHLWTHNPNMKFHCN